MDRSIEEAALDLGANEWTTFFRITSLLQRRLSSLRPCWFYHLVDDYLITSFVRGSAPRPYHWKFIRG